MELAMCRADRVLVTVLCRERPGLLVCGADAVASLALELSELDELSLSDWPSRCSPAIGVGRLECCRVGVVAGGFCAVRRA
jgi:hypothetical protein